MNFRRFLSNNDGQVAVEFIFMLILSASVLIYLFYFSFSIAALQHREYWTFMVGRAVMASSPTYKEKETRAKEVQGFYSGTESAAFPVVGRLDCGLDPIQGFRNILKYGAGAGYDVISTTGIACSVKLNNILPLSDEVVDVAIESMTGSEISDRHCKCAMDFGKSWKGCLTGGEQPTKPPFIDNGC